MTEKIKTVKIDAQSHHTARMGAAQVNITMSDWIAEAIREKAARDTASLAKPSHKEN